MDRDAPVPRMLAIMGSGETAPPMAKVHRALLARLGRSPARAALLDTPYGFQENAAEITSRALDYFREHVGQPLTVATLQRDDPDPLRHVTAVARAREADYLFSGPGSPSYALRQWQGSELSAIVADKLGRGGIVTFASAAALTLGRHTLPVYEIYKVGEPVHWLDGLDLLSAFGLPVAVVPHYDNAEGGTHDTRFCYLGERRLAVLESMLPPDSFVLGVDSHTALVLDLAADTAAVEGLGRVTVRASGRSVEFPRGSQLTIGELRAAAARLREAGTGSVDAGVPSPPADVEDGDTTLQTPLDTTLQTPLDTTIQTPLDTTVRTLEVRFEHDLSTELTDAARTLLAMEQLLHDWSADTGGTGDLDRVRSVFRGMIARLGERAGSPAAGLDAARIRPIVELLVGSRARSRAAGDYAGADAIRDALTGVGVELRDGPDGTTWEMRGNG